MTKGTMQVQVVYALPERQLVLRIDLQPGSTVRTAIEVSGILERFPEINLSMNVVGVFGTVCKPDRVLDPDDRVEIYRPLVNDPKETRRERAETARKKRNSVR
jgi:putative ubiquitin-RnfH superfamily antitoxin RatB of RatAB toxin-antitoxin module